MTSEQMKYYATAPTDHSERYRCLGEQLQRNKQLGEGGSTFNITHPLPAYLQRGLKEGMLEPAKLEVDIGYCHEL